MVDTRDKNVPKPSMLFFFIATTIYSVIKYNIGEKSLTLATICYIITIVIGHYLINVDLVTKTCNSPNWRLAFIVTIVPWVMMFGTIILILTIYPGWKTPFSNTFGYGMTRFAGAKKITSDIFPPANEIKGNDSNANSIKESLAYIYSDQSILINEVTPENFDNFWKDTEPIRSEESKTGEDNKLKDKFMNLIKLKDIVGEYVWYMLTGSLVIAVGYNYIIASTCSPSVENIKKQAKKYEEERKNDKEEEDNNVKTIYASQ